MKPSTDERARLRAIAAADCPICSNPMQGRAHQDFTCKEHWCCKDCADKHTQTQVERGLRPRCISCKVETDPLQVVGMLSSREEKERFLNFALWSDPAVQACPKCRCILYHEGPTQLSTISECPACHHIFCSDCRCPQHPGRRCEEALKEQKAALEEEALVRMIDNSLKDLKDVEKAAAKAKAAASLPRNGDISPPTPRRIRGPMGTESMQDFERAMHSSGCKLCPRCRTGVEKSDDGCDHMTCTHCQHEFCWSCLADRGPIFAHGNHHHRQGCAFFRAWNGKDEWIPKKCAKCAFRGRACRPPNEKAPQMRNEQFLVFLDGVGQWFEQVTQAASQPSFFGTCSMSSVPR